jgi:hypothetical protein
MIHKFIAVCTIISVILLSCSKGDSTQPFTKLAFADSSETKPYLDSTNFGVYKGVIAGGAGYLKIYFYNGDTLLKAFVTVDSLSDTLYCTQNFAMGSPISLAQFSGRISSFAFGADTSGQAASVTALTITGRTNMVAQIAHESSAQIVYCYVCKYSGNEIGYFNFVKYGNKIAGVAKNNNGDTYKGDGTIAGNIFSVDLSGAFTDSQNFEGGIDAINKDNVSGTWIKSTTSSGAFSGVRVL